MPPRVAETLRGLPPITILDHLGYQRRPTRLMAGSEPGPVVAVEVFVEEIMIAPVWIALEACNIPEDWSAPPCLLIAQKDTR